jgi:DHA1 family tetracycline resistance protein-like MFS transporter
MVLHHLLTHALGWSIFGVLSSFFAMSVGVQAFGLGVSWALNEGAQLVAAPMLGRVSDAIGRRPIIVGAFAWTSTIVGVTAFVTTAWGYILARAISGFGQPIQSLLAAVLTDLIPEKERSARFGSFMAVPFMTFVLGAGIGSLLIICGLEIWQAILVACGAMWISTVIAFFLLPETLPRALRRPLFGYGGAGSARRDPDDNDNDAQKLNALLNVGILLVWFSRATSSFAIVAWMLTYPYLIKDAFGWGPTEFGFIMMVLCLVVGASQNWVFPMMDKGLGCHLSAGLGQFILVPGLVLLPISVDRNITDSLQLQLTFHAVIMFIAAFSFAVIEVSIPRIVAAYVPEAGLMGLAQGATSSCRSVGFILGSLVSGMLWDRYGMYGPYIVGSVLAAVGTVAIGAAFLFGEVSESTPESANSGSQSANRTPLNESPKNSPSRNTTPPRNSTPPNYSTMQP